MPTSNKAAVRDVVVGVDLGTTGVKACVLSTEGNPTVHGEVYSSPLLSHNPGWAEQDPDAIFQTMLSCIRSAIERAEVPPRSIAAISIGTALHSLLAVDDTGRPLSKVLTWADNRSSKQAAILRQSSAGSMLYQRTGMPLHGMSPLPKIMWFYDQRREIFDRTAKFISIKEYVLHKLCGSWVVDYSTASGTGLFNVCDLRWDAEALDLAHIRATQLSVPASPLQRIDSGIHRDFTAAMGLPADIRIILGASDAILSHLGVGAFDLPSCSVTIGTSSGLRVFASSPIVDTISSGAFCYAFTEGRWLVGCLAAREVIALRWFNENFPGVSGLGKSSEQNSLERDIESALKVSIGAGGLIFLPFIAGERAPGRTPDAQGVFFGVGLHHKREHFIRAIIEGIVLSVCSLFLSLERLGMKPHESRVSGGFAGMAGIRQIIADAFGHDVLTPKVQEACSYGAALLAMHGLGFLRELKEIPNQVQVDERFHPDKERHLSYIELAKLFEDIYHRLEPSFTDLANLRHSQIHLEK